MTTIISRIDNVYSNEELKKLESLFRDNDLVKMLKVIDFKYGVSISNYYKNTSKDSYSIFYRDDNGIEQHLFPKFLKNIEIDESKFEYVEAGHYGNNSSIYRDLLKVNTSSIQERFEEVFYGFDNPNITHEGVKIISNSTYNNYLLVPYKEISIQYGGLYGVLNQKFNLEVHKQLEKVEGLLLLIEEVILK